MLSLILSLFLCTAQASEVPVQSTEIEQGGFKVNTIREEGCTADLWVTFTEEETEQKYEYKVSTFNADEYYNTIPFGEYSVYVTVDGSSGAGNIFANTITPCVVIDKEENPCAVINTICGSSDFIKSNMDVLYEVDEYGNSIYSGIKSNEELKNVELSPEAVAHKQALTGVIEQEIEEIPEMYEEVDVKPSSPVVIHIITILLGIGFPVGVGIWFIKKRRKER